LAVTRRNLFRAAQWIFAGLVLLFAGRALFDQWNLAEARFIHVHLKCGSLLLASLIVLATYAVLIEGWRRVLQAWGGRLNYLSAARIWCISNLGKYVPGNVWSLTAMGVMSRNRGISAVAATASSVIMQMLTLTLGLAVVLLTGSELIGQPLLVGAAALVLVGLILFAPRILPPLTRVIGRITGREIQEPRIPAGTVWGASIAAGVTWILYGVAFRIFTTGVLGSAPGATLSYIAVYTAAYILGFISPIAPAGLGVREVALAAGMAQFGLATEGDAALVALTARLWLTIVELIPSGIFIAVAAVRRRETSI